MHRKRISHMAAALCASVAVLAAAACGGDPQGDGSSRAASADVGDCPKGTLNAEGSSAQKNAIEEVISNYNAKCADATVNYNATASGAGIKQFNNSQVDFAGSDSILKTEAVEGVVEADAAKKRCAGNPAWNLPMVTGPIALAYNVDGLDKLTLDGPTAAKIFAGTVKTWNAPEISKLNPGITLPSAAIAVFFRSDDSGTTENFSRYLAAAGGDAWKAKPSKKWPGTGLGKEKSSGVAEGVKSTKNSLTYVEWSYAVDNKLNVARIDNGTGAVELNGESAGQALAAAKIVGTGNDLALKVDYGTRAPGAYPIILVTYEIVCSKGLAAEKTSLIKSFLGYFASTDGQSTLSELNYAPLPEQIRTKVEAAVQAIS